MSMTLRQRFAYIKYLEDSRETFGSPKFFEDYLADEKRALRKILKGRDIKDRRIVKNYGMDGFVLLIELPEWVKTYEDAEYWFEENERRVCRPSMYDCTGDSFTSWYKLFQRNGRWMCYHSVAFDL